MSEDILSELTYDDWLETEPGWVNVPQPILDQAAEEITRLRARVDVLERAMKGIAEFCGEGDQRTFAAIANTVRAALEAKP